ncbi:MAG TPA: SAM-dependent methyltransferase [Candidatus Aquabacterium excrementipullorum]|nr:SAM-dependent methyltransferase [Candidatus Aquabacterium excrementipullorum]
MGLLSRALDEGHCEKLMLAGYHGDEPQLERVLARPIELRGQPQLSLVWRYKTRDITKNLPLAEALATLPALLGPRGFRNAHLHTPGEEVQLAFSKKGKGSVRVGKVAGADNAGADDEAAAGAHEQRREPHREPNREHNREKHRYLELSRPFLRELGVTDAQGRLVPAMSRKWKQINKFVEVLAGALAASPLADARQVNVVDFGSGKGYLTFAVHDWLRHTRGVDARVTGVELRQDLVALCGGVIDRLGLEGMAYEQGDVRDYHPQALNVMIALHACDIATDYAIHLGIRAGAEIILSSPCCHKQVRPQLLSPHPLRPILQHGIHLGQEAEMLTDGLRALLLDAAGYDTQVFEFISLEHTNKNKMILAVKRAKPRDNTEVLAQIREIKAFYGIREQALESLLIADGRLAAAA